MPTKLRAVLTYNPLRDILRRAFKAQTGYYKTAKLGNGSGRVDGTRLGYYYVRDIGSADANGNITLGAPYQLPVDTNAIIWPRPNREVKIGKVDGEDHIVGMVRDDLVDAGIDPTQFNPANPRNRFRLIEDLQNLQGYLSSATEIQVMDGIYQKASGTYGMFVGQTAIDILTTYQPATDDNQVVVCLWLNELTNLITSTGSSELSQNTNLLLSPTTALTYVNECAAARPYGSIGTTSFIVKGDGTITKFWDLRGIIGNGGASPSGWPYILDHSRTIKAKHQQIVKYQQTIESGGQITIESTGQLVIAA